MLLDLDGPVTRLFPDPTHLELTARLADLVAERAGLDLHHLSDHVQLLREVARLAASVWPEVADVATRVEGEAADPAVVAVGAHDFVRSARQAGMPWRSSPTTPRPPPWLPSTHAHWVICSTTSLRARG